MKISHIATALAFIVACTTTTDRTSTAGGDLSLYYDTTTTLSAGANNDLTVPSSSSVISVVPHSSGSTVTGIDSTTSNAGDVFWLLNESSNLLTVTDSDVSSTAADRLHLPDGLPIVIPPGRAVAFEYAPNDVTGWQTLTSPGMRNVSSTSAPSRALGTAFRPSTSRVTSAYYSVRITTPLTVSGGAVGRVELLSDSANPPTTVRARAACGSTGVVLLGTSTATLCESELHYMVPINDFLLIQSVTESGSPTFSITTQAEQLF